MSLEGETSYVLRIIDMERNTSKTVRYFSETVVESLLLTFKNPEDAT